MRKIKLRRHACVAVGMAGAVFTALGGLSVALGWGPARLAHTIGFVLTGAMLLLLGVCEKGDDKRRLRAKLLGLFFALMVAASGLPPLDALWVLVVPGLLGLYRQPGDGKWLVLALLGEVASAAARLLALTPLLGPSPQTLVAWVLVVTAAVRFLALGHLFLWARRQAPPPQQEPVHRLR